MNLKQQKKEKNSGHNQKNHEKGMRARLHCLKRLLDIVKQHFADDVVTGGECF